MSKKWANAKVPEGLQKAIIELINKYEDLGYHSFNAFVTDACRRRLEELQKMIQKEAEITAGVGETEPPTDSD